MSTYTADPTATGSPERTPHPMPGLWPTVKKVLKPLASLQLTVTLFAMSMVLVFFGTVAQKQQGIWTIVDQYFWSWIVMIDLQLPIEFGKIFFGLSPDLTLPSWAKIPFPGGKLIGGLMFANLIAAHLIRFKLSWKRTGIITLHAGMLLMFIGEFITREYQIEQQMQIIEGASKGTTFDHRNAELVFVDSSNPSEDHVTAVSGSLLKRFAGKEEAFDSPELPASIEVVKWFPNSRLLDAKQAGIQNYSTHGRGLEAIAEDQPEVSGVSQEQKVDLPSAYIRLYKKGTDQVIGSYLVSLLLSKPETVEIDGKKYEMSLRFVHYYKPFQLKLEKLHVDYYPGSQIPKNYSSDLQLSDSEAGITRPVTIAMNEPLRYRGETFYQSQVSLDPETRQPMTTLQVVRNPGWVLPYLSCVLVSLGMILHFGLNLGTFLERATKSARQTTATVRKSPMLPIISMSIVGLYVASNLIPRSPPADSFDMATAARIPVLEGGRVKPLDSVARKDLRLITHRETITDSTGEKRSAIQWYFDTASMPQDNPRDSEASKMDLFRVENDQLWNLLKLKRREGLRYSLLEIMDQFDALNEAAQKIEAKPEKDRSAFDGSVIELTRHIKIMLDVWKGQGQTAADILPPHEKMPWRKPGNINRDVEDFARETAIAWIRENKIQNIQQLNEKQRDELEQVFNTAREQALKVFAENDPSFTAWNDLLAAYRTGNVKEFNEKVAKFKATSDAAISSAERTQVKFETFLNEFAPYYLCTGMYVVAFLLTIAGWGAMTTDASLSENLRRSAFWVLVLTFALHTFSLISRMYLMDRPLVFVTNLYSSAVFIGWAAAGICLIIERIFPLSIGNTVAAVLGFSTSIIAHNLATSGDTLEMMQAVLDTNFWLATHVTTVTLGYSATYVAGVLGLAYIGLGLFTTVLRQETNLQRDALGRGKDVGKILSQLMYGVICFAMLLSFVGTVLGGIWADQSWGRFWGWDPKENGAVLIVIWNALILHARWCGLIKDRGVALLAIAGNMVTTWSWFGTNQLGIGLHAYGFNKQLVQLCVWVWVTHALVIAMGLTPPRFWASRPDVRA